MREVETREALSQHYLELRASPGPSPTRTRARSAAGPPPEWLTGAHGEAVLLPGPEAGGPRPGSPAGERAAALRASEAAAQRAREPGGEGAPPQGEGGEGELCLAAARRVAHLCRVGELGLAGHDVLAAEVVKAAAEELLDALEVVRALGLVLGERGRAPKEVVEYTARVAEAVERQQAAEGAEGARGCRRETHLPIRSVFRSLPLTQSSKGMCSIWVPEEEAVNRCRHVSRNSDAM